jgi:hypothetical protein
MKGRLLLSAILALFGILIAVLFFQVVRLENRLRASSGANDAAGSLQESLKRVQTELASTKELLPGLGEYMTTIQLHTAKLWFAGKASNWELASIKRRNPAEFQKSYDATLGACNDCHTETGHKFIQIIRPTTSPVTNQKWGVADK